MPSQMDTKPEQARIALCRHIANKLGMDDHELQRATGHLPIKDLVDCLDIRVEGTRRRFIALGKAAAARAKTPCDHRTATHDGFIWSQERKDMRDGDAIIQRMAYDMRRAAPDCADGSVCVQDLARLGWPAWIIRAYGEEAGRAANMAEAA